MLPNHIAKQIQPILQLLLPPLHDDHSVQAVNSSSLASLFLGELLAANIALSLSTAAGGSNSFLLFSAPFAH